MSLERYYEMRRAWLERVHQIDHLMMGSWAARLKWPEFIIRPPSKEKRN